MDYENRACRICLDSGDYLISPCLCNSFVHKSCLNKWREQNRGNSYHECEVCKYKYQFRRFIYADLLKSKWTNILLSTSVLGLYCFASGYISAIIINTLYSYLMHKDYVYVHRLQVLFYGLINIAIPGIYLTIKDLMSFNEDMRHMPRIEPIRSDPVIPHIYIPINTYSSDNTELRNRSGNTSSSSSSIGSSSSSSIGSSSSSSIGSSSSSSIGSSTKKIADYKSPGILIWALVIIFACRTSYALYIYISNKINMYCIQAQEMIENVRRNDII